MNRGSTAYLPRSSAALAALLLSDVGQKTTPTAETTQPMMPVGKIIRSSLGGQEVVIRATTEDGQHAPVHVDAEDRILVPEQFRGRIDLQIGDNRAQILVGLPAVPTDLRYPLDPVGHTGDVTVLRSMYEMPTLNCSSDRRSPPSSKRGARAAHRSKPWQGGGWRSSSARPGRR